MKPTFAEAVSKGSGSVPVALSRRSEEVRSQIGAESSRVSTESVDSFAFPILHKETVEVGCRTSAAVAAAKPISNSSDSRLKQGTGCRGRGREALGTVECGLGSAVGAMNRRQASRKEVSIAESAIRQAGDRVGLRSAVMATVMGLEAEDSKVFQIQI